MAALYWQIRAAQNGHSEAQFQLGYKYFVRLAELTDKEAQREDKRRAEHWLVRAAAQGHPEPGKLLSDWKLEDRNQEQSRRGIAMLGPTSFSE